MKIADAKAGSAAERIRIAAETVVARRGFDAATVPEIAAEAGLSVGLLYRYYEGKAALAVAIVEAERARTRAGIDALIREVPDPKAALRLLIEEWLAIGIADRAEAALLAEIAAQATRIVAIREVVLAADREAETLIASLIARACPQHNATLTAAWLSSTLDGLVVRAAIDRTYDPRPVGPVITALLMSEERIA